MRGIIAVSLTDQLSGNNWKLGSDSAAQPWVGLNLQTCYLGSPLCRCHLMFDRSLQKKLSGSCGLHATEFCSNQQ